MGSTAAVGYNTTFLYPEHGLDSLSRALASRCDIQYGKQIARIDTEDRILHFADDSKLPYRSLLSTLPLNRSMEMAGLEAEAEPNPSTSVLVLNIGARRGARCPDDHWLYIPSSEGGFHRVGFYSNVDRSFLPASSRAAGDRVSIYVELAPRAPLDDATTRKLGDEIVRELQAWGFIEEVEVVDPTFIDVAYTWSRPGSRWPEQALQRLEEAGIHAIGRYARWNFQGIADSIRDGLYAGAAFRTESVR
jgi:protoporphyrinogen oxidase